ncbi:glycosyltransferase [Kocuria sp. HSID16901]|uniref:glycosyltransferase n=1 Tax=Kocuria sp. HSID16901 TaxID=2419505 RepID=UPI001386BE51|nr:glycosyltransferase [Kocuria sp. HSID16901]MCT1368113.1 glycosyltransferase [Rothia sp. p3-SID1597]
MTQPDEVAAELRSWPERCRRVVFVCHRIPELSGGAVSTETLSLALQEAGLDVEHVSVKPGTRTPKIPTTTVFEREDLHFRPLVRGEGHSIPARAAGAARWPLKRWDRHRVARRAAAYFDALGPETVVVVTHAAASLALDGLGISLRGRQFPVIGQHHAQYESLDVEPNLREMVEGQFGEGLDAFTALSAGDAELFAHIIDAPSWAVGNPIRPTDRTSAHDRPEAVALGRYVDEKLFDLMIRVFAQVTEAPDLAHWKLRIYGDGPERTALERQIRESNVGHRVVLEGPTEDVEAAYETARVNLVTCRDEGFGMTIIEAGRAGVPTVAFDCSPGVRGLLPEGAGVLVSPMTEDRFAQALADSLRRPEQLREMGHQAQSVASQFFPENLVRQWGEIVTGAYEAMDRRRRP